MNEPFRKRMETASKKKSSIVLALDPTDRKNLVNFAKKTIGLVQQHICAVKINFHLILPLSVSDMQKLNKIIHSYGLQSIADIKLNDIEHTNEVALDYLAKMGFDAVIANPFIGKGGLLALVDRAHRMNAGVLALVYMSHPGAKEGYGLQVADGSQIRSLYSIFLERALQSDADGIIVGATQNEILKEIGRERHIPVYSPGIGAQGGDVEQAVKNGADYLIIGRSIVDSKDPLKTVQGIKSRILASRKSLF